jgi:hypothetical protein
MQRSQYWGFGTPGQEDAYGGMNRSTSDLKTGPKASPQEAAKAVGDQKHILKKYKLKFQQG